MKSSEIDAFVNPWQKAGLISHKSALACSESRGRGIAREHVGASGGYAVKLEFRRRAAWRHRGKTVANCAEASDRERHISQAKAIVGH
jgi:hypothetical protein